MGVVGKSVVPAPGRARLKNGEFDISLSCIDGVFRQNKQNTTKKQRTNKAPWKQNKINKNENKVSVMLRVYISQQQGGEVIF